MAYYDCLNKANHKLCSPASMANACAAMDKDACTNKAPFNSLCQWKDGQCTISDAMKDRVPVWDAQDHTGVWSAFYNKTVPLNAHVALSTTNNENKPAVGGSAYKLMPASIDVVKSAEKCHNAGGLWLANPPDTGKEGNVSAGWGCINPKTPVSGPKVHFDGSAFEKLQKAMGLDTSILGTNDAADVTAPPKADLIVDYWDCQGSDKKWVALQNNPCQNCSLADMFGLWEVTETQNAAKSAINTIGDLLGDLKNWKTWLFYLVIVLLVLCCGGFLMKCCFSSSMKG